MPALRYLDFDLQIERQGDGFVAEVIKSPVGEASNSFTLPFTDDRLENLLLKMGPLRARMRGVSSDERAAARELGSGLFDAVFSGEVLAVLRGSLDDANREEGTGLRLRLRLQDAPELADLPWEFLFDRSLGRFLAQSSYTPIVRYLEMHERIRPLLASLPLRVLVMISSPVDPDYPLLDVEAERKRLEVSLNPLIASGKVSVHWLDKATLPELQARLRSGEYHVFHFIGHGGFDQASGQGVLVLEDEQGRGSMETPDRICPLLHDHRSLRLAVLNSCEGARNSRSDPFAGMASSLIRQGIPSVVAMQFEITDKAAVTFAGEFYSALAESFPVDAAISEARKAILAQGNDIEWGTPVLYMRAADGVLFDLSAPAVLVPPVAVPPPEPAPPPAAGPVEEAGTALPLEATAPAGLPPAGPPSPLPAPGIEAAEAIALEPASPAPEPAMPEPAPSLIEAAPEPAAPARMEAVTLGLRPLPGKPGEPSLFELAVRNDNPGPVDLDLRAADPQGRGAFVLPASIAVDGGRTRTIEVTARPRRRRLTGGRAMRPFSIEAAGSGRGGPPVAVTGEFEDLPMGWRPIAGGGLLASVAAAVVAGILLIPGGSPPLPPDETGIEPAIFFTSDRDGQEEVYVMAPDGSRQTRLTRAGDPSRLPDGLKYDAGVIYAHGPDTSSELFIMRSDGTDVRAIRTTDGSKLEPNVSPDGTRIVFEVKRGDDYEIYVSDIDGANAVNVSRSRAADIDPVWSPDGALIAFASNRDGGGNIFEIYVMNADGANPVRLTRDGRYFNAEPSWSPEGDFIAYQSNRAGGFDIWVMTAAGEGARRVTPDQNADEFDPAWSLDGSQIAYTSSRAGVADVYVINADGSGARNLTASSRGNDLKPSWGYAEVKITP